MTLSSEVGNLELELSKLKEVVRRDFEVKLRSQTDEENLIVGNLDSYSWKRDSPFMNITLNGSVLGYIFPLQQTAFLFDNTSRTLVSPLHMVFEDSGYKPNVNDMYQEAYSIIQHEEMFNQEKNLAHPSNP